jgi:hypothetical protein
MPPSSWRGVTELIELVFDDLLEVLADPADEDHHDMLEWVGGRFDPEAFDREVVRERLRFLRPQGKRRR